MGTWLNPIDRSITTKYRVGCTKFSILSLITLSKLQNFFAKFFKKQFPQRKYKVTFRICCYFFCCVPYMVHSFYSWKFVLNSIFTTWYYDYYYALLQVRWNIWERWGFTKKHLNRLVSGELIYYLKEVISTK